MKKSMLAFTAAISSAIAVICLSGYGYIFKALLINLKKGAFTPSIDDVGKFPFHLVNNHNPKQWKKTFSYNRNPISEKLLKDLKKTRVSSLVVIKDNKILHEQYWKDHDSSSLINSFSMAKGILSILVGFAIEEGRLESENQLLSSLFPHYKSSQYGKFLTLRHLMTMQAGMDWDEEYHHPFAPNSKQYFIEDLAKQAFDVEIKEMPGMNYNYQSVAAQLLGLALKKAVGNELASYLSEKLWKPLGMEFSAKWSVDTKGMEKAFCCIHASSRDFAKIGQFIMQKGKWQGKQLLSEEYCEKLLKPTQSNSAFCFTIWADDDSRIKCRFFYGFLGQFIIIVPEKNLVIVKTGFYNRLKVDEKLRPLQVKLLVEELSELF